MKFNYLLSAAILTLLFTPVSALKVDEQTLLRIVQDDPFNVQDRKILAHYYFKQKEFDKSLQLCDQVLLLDKDASKIRQLREKALYGQQMSQTLKAYNLLNVKKDEIAATLGLDQTEFLHLYEALIYFNRELAAESNVRASREYLALKNYVLSQNALNRLGDSAKKRFDGIQADLYFEQENYTDALHLYSVLNSRNEQRAYSFKILECYIYLNDYRSVGFYTALAKRYPDDKELMRIKELLDNSVNRQLKGLKQVYTEQQSFQTLKNYTSALYAYDERPEAIGLSKAFYEQNASDESALLLARYYYWNQDYPNALKVSQSAAHSKNSDLELLQARVYAETQQYDKAKVILQKLSTEPDTAFESKKLLAFIAMWQNEKKEAIVGFESLMKVKDDEEIRNALFILRSSDEEKISQYQNSLKRNPQDLDTKLHLAQLYIKTPPT